MEIRTKFNVGDYIWCVGFNYDDEEEIFFGEIKDIKVSHNENFYSITSCDYIEFNEKNCFATKEEAQKECDKRNGKS